MTMEQILLWLLGPGVASFISFLLDQNVNWRDWKPAPLLGFNPKAILVSIGAGAIGLLTYGVATNRPDIINTADPIVQTWFPLLAPIVVQIWHSFVNKRLSATEVKATIPEGIEGTVSATATAQSGTTNPDPNVSTTSTAMSGTGTNSPGQGSGG